MVKVIYTNVLPAIVFPMLVNNNPKVGSIECILVNYPSIPIFNCGQSEVTISINPALGCVKEENAWERKSELVKTNLAEIDFAVRNTILLSGKIIKISIPVIKCNAVVDSDALPLSSSDIADLNDQQMRSLSSVRVISGCFQLQHEGRTNNSRSQCNPTMKRKGNTF